MKMAPTERRIAPIIDNLKHKKKCVSSIGSILITITSKVFIRLQEPLALSLLPCLATILLELQSSGLKFVNETLQSPGTVLENAVMWATHSTILPTNVGNHSNSK